MADKLLIISANIDPNDSEVVGIPFFQATVAAAMEYDVELIFTGRSSRMADIEVAKNIAISDGTTVLDLFENAKLAGVQMKLCSHSATVVKNQVDAISEIVGSAYIIQQTMDDEVVVLSY